MSWIRQLAGRLRARGCYARIGLVTVVILAQGSCLYDMPEICYDVVEVCGVSVEGMEARLIDGGCDDDYWVYSVRTGSIGCDDEGRCAGTAASFDLRTAGYDAVGAVEVEIEMLSTEAVVTGTRTCVGMDCERVSDAFGVEPFCGERRSGAESCGDGDTAWGW